MPEHPQPVVQADRQLEVFEVLDANSGQFFDDLREPGFLQKASGGNDGLDVGSDAGGLQTVRTRRVIEQRRHAPACGQGENQSERRCGIGRQHTDDFSWGSQTGHQPHHAERHLEQ